MTETDQAIEEVRRSRCRMSEQCGHDPSRLVQLLQGFSRRYAVQVRRYEDAHRAVGATHREGG